jgi:acetolactate synthase-1/2/3 large subunit
VLRELAAAKRPVIVAGGGVRVSGAGAELVALAEALRIPVATSANGKDTIAGTHPLSAGVVGSYSRECANEVAARADLVCFVSTATGGMTTHFWAVPPIGTPAVQIDIEPSQLGRNYPLRASIAAEVDVHADIDVVAPLPVSQRPAAAPRRGSGPRSSRRGCR